MKTANNYQKLKSPQLVLNQDDLNNSPIATVSAVANNMQSGSKNQNKSDDFFGGGSAQKKLHNSSYGINGKAKGCPNNNFHQVLGGYDLSQISPSKYGRLGMNNNNSSTSSYLTYLCQHDFEAKQHNKEGENNYTKVKTPQGLSLRMQGSYQPVLGGEKYSKEKQNKSKQINELQPPQQKQLDSESQQCDDTEEEDYDECLQNEEANIEVEGEGEEDFKCYEGEHEIEGKSSSNKSSLQSQNSEKKPKLQSKISEKILQQHQNREIQKPIKYGSVTSQIQRKQQQEQQKKSDSRIVKSFKGIESSITNKQGRGATTTISNSCLNAGGEGGIGLRKSSNNQSTNTLDKSCNSSSRQTPSSTIGKRQNMKSSQNKDSMIQIEQSKTTIYKSNNQLSSSTKEEITPSITTIESQNNVIRQSKTFNVSSIGNEKIPCYVEVQKQSQLQQQQQQHQQIQSQQQIESIISNNHQRKQSTGGLHSIAMQSQRKLGDQRNGKMIDQVDKAMHSYEKATQQEEVNKRISDLSQNNSNNHHLNNTGHINIANSIINGKQYNFAVHQQLPNLSTNSSIGFNDPSQGIGGVGGVTSFMYTQKKNKAQGTGSGKKKKTRKRTVTKKNIGGGILGQTPYSLVGAQAQKFATPKETLIGNNNVYQAVAFTVQELKQNPANEYGTNANSNNNKFFHVNNENQQNEIEQKQSIGSVNGVSSQQQRSSSNNNRIQQNNQPSNSTKKRIQPSKTTSFTNAVHQSTSSALTQIINQTTISQPVLQQSKFPNQQQPQQTKKKQWNLLDSEKQLYGDRVPKGYEKLDLLGKGGCAIVWLARNIKTEETVALKQFPKVKTNSIDSTAKVEIQFGRALFPRHSNGKVSYGVDPIEYPGIKYITKLMDDIDEPKDYWLVYEVGSHSLSKQLYEVKGEFYKGERIYHVLHQDFYHHLKGNLSILRGLIRKLAETFQVLSEFKIVHADIKPDNILISFDGREIKDVKLIDFGSAFSFENPSNIQASTPEYLAPEVLEYLENRAHNTMANGTNSSNLCKKIQPWSYDIWSFGALLLEIMTGFPLWLSLKGRITTLEGKSIIGTGLFGVQGREGKKILQKQFQILRSIPAALKKYECNGLDKNHDFMDLLQKMLEFNPIKRISPDEILQHPFLEE